MNSVSVQNGIARGTPGAAFDCAGQPGWFDDAWQRWKAYLADVTERRRYRSIARDYERQFSGRKLGWERYSLTFDEQPKTAAAAPRLERFQIPAKIQTTLKPAAGMEASWQVAEQRRYISCKIAQLRPRHLDSSRRHLLYLPLEQADAERLCQVFLGTLQLTPVPTPGTIWISLLHWAVRFDTISFDPPATSGFHKSA